MTQNTISILQAIGISVQIINAGIATKIHDSLISLIVAGIAGGYQYYVQHLGNASTPPEPPTNSKGANA